MEGRCEVVVNIDSLSRGGSGGCRRQRRRGAERECGNPARQKISPLDSDRFANRFAADAPRKNFRWRCTSMVILPRFKPLLAQFGDFWKFSSRRYRVLASHDSVTIYCCRRALEVLRCARSEGQR